jgi:hypothetical protein
MRGILLRADRPGRLGQIGHVDLAVKRQQVVFAQAEEFDILHHHHLVVLHLVERAIEKLLNIGAVSAGEELEGLVHALGSAQQAVASGVLAQFREDLPDLRNEIGNCSSLLGTHHHFTTALFRFHGSPFQRCFEESRRCGLSPAGAIRREMPRCQFRRNLRQISIKRFSEVGDRVPGKSLHPRSSCGGRRASGHGSGQTRPARHVDGTPVRGSRGPRALTSIT